MHGICFLLVIEIGICWILLFNSDPESWWSGQFKTWVLRMNDKCTRDINLHFQTHKVAGTIVGLHIRRTDKKSEAKYHSLDEYMIHVAEWYDAYELLHPNVTRKLYIATDEPAIIDQAKREYPGYELIYDRNITYNAFPQRRHSILALQGIIKDIYSIVRCDFVVCTMSSNVCRLGYELAQAKFDAVDRYQSLDRNYFVATNERVYGVVTRGHTSKSQNEMNASQGDIVRFHGNNWAGYVRVANTKNPRNVYIIPAFKVQRIYKTYNYSSKIKTIF